MEQNNRVLYLIKFDVLDVAEDFAKIIAKLSSFSGYTVSSLSDASVTVTSEGVKQPIQWSLASYNFGPTITDAPVIRVTSDRTDSDSVYMTRLLAADFGYRVYDSEYGCFLPKNPELIYLHSLIPDNKIEHVFKTKEMIPMYYLGQTTAYYVVHSSDHAVYIINPGVLKYFMDFDVDAGKTPEFAYKVAENMSEFSVLFDEELVPLTFYRYYRRDNKIMNYSFIDVRRPDRKMFIKPYFCIYNVQRQVYEPISDKSALSFADKIRPGESLDTALTRIVRDELKLRDGYQRAKVDRYVSFDRDKEGILTPLLHVTVYLKSVSMDLDVAAQSQRGWQSLDKQVN